jgi:hypothetical protein
MISKKLFTGLTLLGTLSLYPFEAKAVPDPAFNPILGDIQNSLPRGMVMRLPSKLRLYDYQNRRIDIYPRVQSSDANRLIITLNTKPNCYYNSCLSGFLTVTRVLNSYDKNLITGGKLDTFIYPLTGKKCGDIRRENVLLRNSLQGTFIDSDRCGNGALVQSSRVIWKQDGYFFTARIGTHKLNSIVDIARSMASEPPIRSSL